jgi:hypothetical protein
MSAPVKKGNLTTAVEEVWNGTSVTTSGGFSTSVTQSKLPRPRLPVANGAAPDYDELTQLVETSLLDRDAKEFIKLQLARLQSELSKENDGDAAAVRDSLRSVSDRMPDLRPKLKLWIEHSPHASESIQIVASKMLG